MKVFLLLLLPTCLPFLFTYILTSNLAPVIQANSSHITITQFIYFFTLSLAQQEEMRERNNIFMFMWVKNGRKRKWQLKIYSSSSSQRMKAFFASIRARLNKTAIKFMEIHFSSAELGKYLCVYVYVYVHVMCVLDMWEEII